MLVVRPIPRTRSRTRSRRARARARRVRGRRALRRGARRRSRARPLARETRDDAFHTIAERGTYLDDEDIDRLLSLSFPGVDELVGLVELTRLSRGSAPTTRSSSTPRPPATRCGSSRCRTRSRASRRCSTTCTRSIGSSRRASAARGGRDFADEMIAEIDARGRVASRPRSPTAARTSFTWVTLPEELSGARVGARRRARSIELGIAVGVGRRQSRLARARPAVRVLHAARVRAEHRGGERSTRRFRRQRIARGPRARSSSLAGRTRSSRSRSSVANADPSATSAPPPKRPARSRARNAERLAGSDLPIPRVGALVLVGGKGGVGKTTGRGGGGARARRRAGRATACWSCRPIRRTRSATRSALGLGRRARRCPADRRTSSRVSSTRRTRWAAQRDRYRGAIDDLFASIFRGRMDATFDRAVLEDLLDLAPPGIDELLALVTITRCARPPRTRRSNGRYDLVVVDTAPTGHTLRLLALPKKALEWVHALDGDGPEVPERDRPRRVRERPHRARAAASRAHRAARRSEAHRVRRRDAPGRAAAHSRRSVSSRELRRLRGPARGDRRERGDRAGMRRAASAARAVERTELARSISLPRSRARRSSSRRRSLSRPARGCGARSMACDVAIPTYAMLESG